MLKKQLARLTHILVCISVFHIRVSAQSMPAQDTLSLTLQQAERLFIDSNLQLLAEHYNIRSAQALVEQARKWDNPMLVTDQNIYTNGKWFTHGRNAMGNSNGQVFVQVQQLIKTAGKRGKQVDLAQTNAQLAEWQFKTIMRELHFTLVKDFFTIRQLQATADLYTDNLQRLQKLEKAMNASLAAGNIAKKEYLRVQALILSLKQDMADNSRNMADVQAELKTMLMLTSNTYLKAGEENTTTGINPPTDINLFALMDTAARYNTDYNTELCQAQYAQQNLRLQKAMAVPDVTLGPEYDQQSNYTPNYYGLSVNLPLPIWDRNQGNIKAARWQTKQEEAMVKQAGQKLKNDVLAAYQKLQLTAKLASADNGSFYADYDQLYKNIVESYNNRQISLIEFLEYFNDYREIKKKQLQQQLDLQMAKAELNNVAGADIIK